MQDDVAAVASTQSIGGSQQVASSEVAALIDRAGEPPAVRFETLDGFDTRDVVKFVMWTQQDDGWAHMPSTVEALRDVLDGTDATILDHGDKFCEVLPPGVNKGAGVARLCEALGVAPESVRVSLRRIAADFCLLTVDIYILFGCRASAHMMSSL